MCTFQSVGLVVDGIFHRTARVDCVAKYEGALALIRLG